MDDESTDTHRIAHELRRAAADGTRSTGPAPVDAVIRRGRRARLRRRLTTVTAAMAALLVPLGLSLVHTDTPTPPTTNPTPANSPRIVQPYAPTPIGENLVMALRPDNGARYVIASPATFPSRMTAAEYLPRTPLPPTSLTLQLYRTDAGITAVTGTWSAPTPPSHITVTAAGHTYTATLLHLPNTETWGTFYATATSFPTTTPITATAYTSDNTPLTTATTASE